MKEGVEDLAEKAFPSALPIVSFVPGDDNVEKAVFHHENLAVALKGCEDIPVFVASVTGENRSGKSYLLNMMVTYLEHHNQSVSSSFRFLFCYELSLPVFHEHLVLDQKL